MVDLVGYAAAQFILTCKVSHNTKKASFICHGHLTYSSPFGSSFLALNATKELRQRVERFKLRGYKRRGKLMQMLRSCMLWDKICSRTGLSLKEVKVTSKKSFGSWFYFKMSNDLHFLNLTKGKCWETVVT